MFYLVSLLLQCEMCFELFDYVFDFFLCCIVLLESFLLFLCNININDRGDDDDDDNNL